jgi:26S proteasome regulatory subunit N7
MTPYYRTILAQTPSILSEPSSSTSGPLLEKMAAANKTKLAELDARLAEAEKTEGETEISEALRAKADHLTRIGDKVRPPLRLSEYGASTKLSYTLR